MFSIPTIGDWRRLDNQRLAHAFMDAAKRVSTPPGRMAMALYKAHDAFAAIFLPKKIFKAIPVSAQIGMQQDIRFLTNNDLTLKFGSEVILSRCNEDISQENDPFIGPIFEKIADARINNDTPPEQIAEIVKGVEIPKANITRDYTVYTS